MSLAGHARSGQGGSNVSKSEVARGLVEKGKKPPFTSDEETSTEESTTASKSAVERARTGDISKMVVKPAPQPSVASNIPGAGPQGVPPAEADGMGAFARNGNANMIPTAVAAQTGLATLGPKVVGSVARMGGQVKLAPGQIRAWAHPTDMTPTASDQVAPVAPAPKVY